MGDFVSDGEYPRFSKTKTRSHRFAMGFEICIDTTTSAKAKKLRKWYGRFTVFGMKRKIMDVRVGVRRFTVGRGGKLGVMYFDGEVQKANRNV